MKRTIRILSASLALVMGLGIVLTGCKKEEKPNNTQATETKKEERIKLTMFMGNSGIAAPDGVNPSDNAFINLVENYANVDLELEVPGYQDFQTKLNLLLSSGNTPDILHSTLPTETYKYADQGAFIDLKKYYDKSTQVKKYITSEMMEITKFQSGKYYRIPMAYDKAPQGKDVIARWDLVKKYNNNKWPTTVDEWVTLFRTIHKAEPNSIVLSNRVVGDYGITYGGLPIFYWYGALPYNYRYDLSTSKAISTFTLPEYKAAVELLKQLYTEGILDKEFATNDTTKWVDRKNNKNCLLDVNGMEQITPNVQINVKNNKDLPQAKDWETLPAPILTKYPAELKDAKYAQPFKSKPVNDHGLYISSKCKEPDRAFRVIEGFASDDLYQAIFWGKEGSEYTVKDGKRVPITEKLTDKSRSWSLHLALIFGFVEGQDVKKATGEAVLGKEYSDMVYKNIDSIDALAKKNGLDPTSFVVLSDNANKKDTESVAYITQATVEAIMGKITMEQFDQRVKEYQTKYGFIADEYTKYITEHKAELTSKGVNFTR